MKQNKKLSLIYIIGVIIPFVLMLVNGYISDNYHKSWSYENENIFFRIVLIVSILSCAVILLLNYRGSKNSLWYTLSLTTGLGIAYLLYLASSFSIGIL